MPPPWWWPTRGRNGALIAPCCPRRPLYQGTQRTTLKHTMQSNARTLWQLRWPTGQLAASRSKPHMHAQHTTARQRLPWSPCNAAPRIFRTSSAPVRRQHSPFPRLRPCVAWQGSKEMGDHPATQLRRLCPGDVRASGGSILLVPMIAPSTVDLEECVRGVD